MCLKQTLQYGNQWSVTYELSRCGWFKIDFIVWKLNFENITVPKNSSLKQTLQYGNLGLDVYQELEKLGLKQTLQYGNPKTNEWLNELAEVFKIDFIVWKCKTITSTAEGTFSLKQTLQYGNLPISCFKRLTMSV